MTSNQFETSRSWTDDIPVCKFSGIGFSYNQVYREDGNQQGDHSFEDKSYHYKISDSGYLYGVFDGHEGSRAADFCSQHMAAELLLGQLTDVKTEEDVKDILRQAFTSVERSYLGAISDILALRASLSYRIEGLSAYEAYKEMPQVVEEINKISRTLSSGTAVALALIYNNKLFVSNVGNCRVLLCKSDPNSVLKVVQLTVDHDLKNEDELLRLSRLGIKIEDLRKHCHLGNQENTRCLGNYLVKGGYKEFEALGMASQEPVIAEPDICGGIQIDESCRFLLVMSAGLFKCIEETMGGQQVNQYIAQCVVEQFRDQATLTSVAQAVVDKVVRLHHDWHMSNSMSNSSRTSGSAKREDITLIVRNFNYPLPNALNTQGTMQDGSISNSSKSSQRSEDSQLSRSQGTLVNLTIASNENEATDDSSSTPDDRNESDTGIGDDKKIKPYVKFGDFNAKFEAALKNGLQLNDFKL